MGYVLAGTGERGKELKGVRILDGMRSRGVRGGNG